MKGLLLYFCVELAGHARGILFQYQVGKYVILGYKKPFLIFHFYFQKSYTKPEGSRSVYWTQKVGTGLGSWRSIFFIFQLDHHLVINKIPFPTSKQNLMASS